MTTPMVRVVLGIGSAGFVDVTAYMEVDMRLPLEVDMQPDQLREDVPAYPAAGDPVVIGQDEQRRFEPQTGPNRNGLDTGCHCLSIWNHVDSCRELRRKWQGLEWDVVGRERPIRHIRDLLNADRGPQLRRPLALISEKLWDCGARMASCRQWGHSMSQTHLGLICREQLTRTIGLDGQPETMCLTRSGLSALCLLTLWHASSWIWRS